MRVAELKRIDQILFIGIMSLFISIESTQAQRPVPVVRSIEIIGNKQFGTRDILDWLGVKRGKRIPDRWPETSVEKLIQSAYQEGYFLFRVDSLQTRWNTDSTTVTLSIWIHEGNRFQTESVSLGGPDSLLNLRLSGEMETRSGRTFDPVILHEDLEFTLTYLENHGLPLGRIMIDSLIYNSSNETSEMAISLRLEPGRPVRYGTIRARGNTLTKQSVILRETRLQSGSIYNHSVVGRARENLIRLNFFDRVDPPEIRFMQEEAQIVFPIKEGRPNTIEGVIGYIPAKTEKVKGYFTGRLNLSFRNLFGTGRLLDVFWEKKDPFSQIMKLGAEEPWILSYPVFAGGRFEQVIRDSTYIERNWRLFSRWAPWSTLSLGIEGGQRSILPDSLSSARQGLAQTRSWVLSGRIDFNNLNDPVNPGQGVHYHTLFTAGRKRHIGPDFLMNQPGWQDVRNTRLIEVDVELLIPLFRGQVVYTGLHGVEVKSGERTTPVTDQVRIGGAKTLRGYPEDAFRGDLVAWFNLEYRYFLGRRSRAFLFLDGGMIQRREEDGLIRQDKFGYGFGIRLETRLGLMGVDYGLGEGDGLMQGKIHVGVSNSF